MLHRVNSGSEFSFGAKLLHSHVNQILADAADVRVGTDLSTDSGHAITNEVMQSNGTTFATTMTLAASRVITLPAAPNANSRLWLKFRHDHSGGPHTITIAVEGGGPTVLTVSSGATAPVEGYAELYFDGSTWRTLGAREGSNCTITVHQ